jgi:large subunit ribosomal protein L22
MATDTTTENAALEARAVVRHLRVTPQKARRIVDLVRGKDTQSVIAMLKFAPQGAAEPVLKLVESAIANLRVKSDEAGVAFDERNLVISTAFVDEGATMKRFRPRAQGRAGRINKRTSHITVVVTSKPEKAAKGGNR